MAWEHTGGVGQTDITNIQTDVTNVQQDVTNINQAVAGIDDAAVGGLAGAHDSLAYIANEIEKHIHNMERWFGAAASPSGEAHVADDDSMTPFVMTSGNDTFGAWLQILGSNDTPNRSRMERIDVHRLLITDVGSNREITRIQIAAGSSGGSALAAGNYTEIMITPEQNAKQEPVSMIDFRAVVGTKMWARCWVDGQNNSDVDFFIGAHEYRG